MKRRLFSALVAILALAAALTWAFWPDPVPVDIATVARAPMEVTVAADGVTHIRNRYDVTAPLAGVVSRLPVEVGDRVEAGTTVVAAIRPLEPAFLDARARAQAEAAVEEAKASLQLARAKLAQAQADQAKADSDFARAEALAARGTIPQQTLESADTARTSARAAVDAARSAVDLQQATLDRAQAQLLAPGGTATSACCVEIKAPASGTVLSLPNASARPVQAGETLMSIGSLGDLEVVVDLLSSDAVKVAPGARAHVDRWGGPQPIEARVRQIEPAAFTKVSALGIEEQRVRVRLDILTPPAQRAGLGDNYRVFVRIVVWSGKDVLQVPIGALFQSGGGWAVFRDRDGRAVLTPVTLGHQTDLMAEVTSGLSAGDRVVAFPGARIVTGVRIRALPGG
ncbi:MAG: HlyD family efflux transporter periplasmic adaptor subunit [Paracoccaceae bacterium]|nr:HlyD family efflux transporter periplasmic adaptor subunit [Paracoccaceae bacterium]